MDMATVDEVDTRVRYLESEVEGEKAVTRHVLEQAIRNGDVLLALRSEVASARLDLNAVTSRADHIAGDVMVGNAALRSHGSLLNVLRQDVIGLRQDMTVLKQDVTVLKQDVTVLKQDVTVLKQDMTVLKQDVTVLRQDMTVLKQDVTVLRQDVTALRQEMESRFEAVERRFEAMERRFEAMERSIDGRFDAVMEAIRALGPRDSAPGLA
jgi:chromosome segregation ATPase